MPLFKGWSCTQITEFPAHWEETSESSQAPSFYSQRQFRPKNLYAGERALRAHEGHLVKSVPVGLSQDQKSKMCSTPKHPAMYFTLGEGEVKSMKSRPTSSTHGQISWCHSCLKFLLVNLSHFLTTEIKAKGSQSDHATQPSWRCPSGYVCVHICTHIYVPK